MKTLPISVLQSLCKNAFLQISACLCRALATKPFEIQTWDLSKLKETVLSINEEVRLFLLVEWYVWFSSKKTEQE